jgi:hypothetical protein
MQLCWGQNDSPGPPSGNPESWVHVQDTVIKKEVAQFCHSGASQRSHGETAGAALLPIALKRCNDTFAYFDRGSLYSIELIVHIYLTRTAATRQIEKIDMIFYKTRLVLPESALKGINGPRVCTQFTSKNRPVTADCKAFQSADKRRVYIYMLNGEGQHRYEVTWVVQDRKYLTRIVDPVAPV